MLHWTWVEGSVWSGFTRVDYLKGNLLILGEKIEHYKESDAWNRRLGRYRVVNPPHPDVLDLESVEIVRSAGYYSLLLEPTEGSTMVSPLKPVNDNEIVLLGLGRGLGETIRFEQTGNCEQAHYSGLVPERIDSCSKKIHFGSL